MILMHSLFVLKLQSPMRKAAFSARRDEMVHPAITPTDTQFQAIGFGEHKQTL